MITGLAVRDNAGGGATIGLRLTALRHQGELEHGPLTIGLSTDAAIVALPPGFSDG